MARAKKTETKKVEVDENAKDTEVLEDVVKEVDKKKNTVKKPKKLTREELIAKLSRCEDDVIVEFKNISRGRFLFVNKFGDAYLDLEPGETEALSLTKAKEICNKSKLSFKEGTLILTKVYDEEYSLSDILKYLKIDRLQKNDYDIFEDLILNCDIDEFEEILKSKDKKFVKKVAGKAIYMHNSDEYDFELSLKQDSVLRGLLNLEVLIY